MSSIKLFLFKLLSYAHAGMSCPKVGRMCLPWLNQGTGRTWASVSVGYEVHEFRWLSLIIEKQETKYMLGCGKRNLYQSGSSLFRLSSVSSSFIPLSRVCERLECLLILIDFFLLPFLVPFLILCPLACSSDALSLKGWELTDYEFVIRKNGQSEETDKTREACNHPQYGRRWGERDYNGYFPRLLGEGAPGKTADKIVYFFCSSILKSRYVFIKVFPNVMGFDYLPGAMMVISLDFS